MNVNGTVEVDCHGCNLGENKGLAEDGDGFIRWNGIVFVGNVRPDGASAI